jgi:hypothetical protein
MQREDTPMDDMPKGTSTRLVLTLIVALVLVVVVIWMLAGVGPGEAGPEASAPAAVEAPGDAELIAE